jgi:thymidylate synthase (FAD)
MKLQVLDHGYVEFIEAWGHGKSWLAESAGHAECGKSENDFECGIIEAARQSTQGSFRGWKPAECGCGVESDRTSQGGPDIGEHTADCPAVKHLGDERLLKHLYSNQHSTPFEFAGMVIEVQAPIFVFREWHRHRTQSYNEMSARYTPLPGLYYHPTYENVIERARAITTNKQAMCEGETDAIEIAHWLLKDQELSVVLEEHYRKGLSIGVPKELARKKMPVDHYSRMRASANLRNWLAFITLRCDAKAQSEIRQYANAVATIINHTFPRTYKLWSKQFFS